MTLSELKSIKESIEKIEKFPFGFPKKVECTDARWQTFFDVQYEWCLSHANNLKNLSTVPNEEQMNMGV